MFNDRLFDILLSSSIDNLPELIFNVFLDIF